MNEAAAKALRGPGPVAFACWSVGLVLSFIVAIGPAREYFRELGVWVSERSMLGYEVAAAFGALVGMTVAASGIQGIAIAIGGALERRRRGEMTPRTEGEGLGRDLAVMMLHGAHAFPVSTLFLPSLAFLRRARRALAHSHARTATGLRLLYYGVISVIPIGLYHWAPFFTDLERGTLVFGCVALGGALLRWPEHRQRTLFGAAACIFLGFLLTPPQQATWGLRLAGAAVTGGVAALPAVLAGRVGSRTLGALGPTLGLLMITCWAWWGEFLLFPASGLAQKLESDARVELHYRNGSGGPRTDNRFLIEACEPGRLLYGSREIEHGITELGDEGRLVGSLAVHTGYNLELDCDARVGYVGSYSGGRIERIGLDPLQLLDPVPDVSIDAPTLLELSPSRERLYAIDDHDGTLHRIDLERGGIDAALGACLPNGVFVDEGIERAYLPSCGYLEIYDMAALDALPPGAERGRLPPFAHIDLRRHPTPPFPMGAKFLRVAGDAESGKAWVTYMEMGRVYLVDGKTGRLEAEGRVGRGIRDIAFDSRNDLLYIGNYVTGELLAVHPRSLEVLGRVQVGRRIRGIEPSMDGRRVYVTSAVGGLSVAVADLVDDGSRD